MEEQNQLVISPNINQYVDAVDRWSNSFLRPHVPPNLLSNSVINRTEDDGAKLIYAKFLYGEKTGKLSTIPFNGSYGTTIDVANDSLWEFSNSREKSPDGFQASKFDGGQIRTGNVQKCSTCRGQGRITCKSCGGKIRWTEKSGDKYIEKVCSCGDGKQICSPCDGYGDVETVILVKTEYKLYETKNSQYTGEVPDDKIKSITGHEIYEYILEYPVDKVKSMIRGGINVEEFNQLNNAVLDLLHDNIDTQLGGKGLKIKEIHKQINDLFKTVPNPGRENKLLEKESIPVRVMIRVEDAPVTQIDYTFKNDDYSLWVFGNENAVWYQRLPFTLNYKIITIAVALIALIAFFVLKN